MLEDAIRFHMGPRLCYQRVVSPKQLWPREADLTDWLVGHLDLLGTCLELGPLALTGREVVVSERVLSTDITGRSVWTGGLRLDITARDAYGRNIVIEAQLGTSDHGHLGQLVTYTCNTEAAVVVWAAASNDCDPPFRAEHLLALAKLNERFSGQCQFAAVQVTLESEVLAAPDPHARVHPQLVRIV
jgi:hypothetical protein